MCRSTVLSPKESIFCKEYVVDYNTIRAAMAAGYAESTAKKQASTILRRPEVQKEIKRLEATRIESLNVQTKHVVDKLWKVAQLCSDPSNKWNPHAAVQACNLLARYTGGFKEQHEHSHKHKFGKGPDLRNMDAEQLKDVIRQCDNFIQQSAGGPGTPSTGESGTPANNPGE